MQTTILNQLQHLHDVFGTLDDIESRVSNIKQRNFLMQRSLNEGKDAPLQKTLRQSNTITVEDTKSDLSDLRAKLLPKSKPKPKTVEDEMAESDRELQDAIDRALAKVK